MDSELKIALMEGYEAALAESGFLRKALTVGALVAGTIFSGCSGNVQRPVPMSMSCPFRKTSR